MSPRFLIAAGGTGGHVQPALAVAQELMSQSPSAHVHFVGGRRGIENQLVPAAGFPLTRLPAAGLRGLGVLGALRFALSFGLAFLASVPLILRLRPAAVLATGGYASAAPSVAAALMGRPLWLQEQNSVPGSTNRFLSRFAERAYVAFEQGAEYLGRAKHVEVLPNPVRAEILKTRGERARAEDYQSFGLQPAGKLTLLVFGGSRGASRLNDAVVGAWLARASRGEWQAIVQTGRDDLLRVRTALSGLSQITPRAYIDDMAAAYRVADLVVCRAGALTLAELAAAGKPAILVPYPHATDDHQSHNAAAFSRAKAARVVSDADFDASMLCELLDEFQENPAVLETMGEAAAMIAAGRNGAAELAAALISRAREGRDA
ncbi:MAG TPA: undecaprenyldiphospho-muramoylpentapeptide beta-N-acetylglucosaminyltransferase [Candidatus Krumholzibacteria bacterium]|nr:undecaprenyldiphospho-muramoylpentapeptide beta-N-acetylglucosaminyltransferase [Candidatus Krumholzibacteria bacterium]